MVRLRPAFKRLRRVALPLSAIGLAIALGVTSSSIPTTSAATKYTAFAGGGRAGIAVNLFRPSTIFVAQGDSIEWVNPYGEIHTLTFVPGTEGKSGFEIAADLPFVTNAAPPPPVGAPSAAAPPKIAINPRVSTPAPFSGAASMDGSTYVNSGVLGQGQSFTVSFPRQGQYRFLCIVHPFQEVNVHVLAPGTTVPTQAMIDAEAAGQLAEQLAKGEAAAAAARPRPLEVLMPPPAEFASINRFIPARIQINVGDTVTWRNPTPIPHTVTFNLPPTPPGLPPFITLEPQPSSPPLQLLTPSVLFPSEPKSFDGTGYVNSGFMGIGAEAPGGPTFSLTFTKAGTYSYICVPHVNQGMVGVVEVGGGPPTTGAGPGGTVRPPSTGDGGLLGASDVGSSLYFYAAGAFVFAFGAVAAVWARSRA